MSLGDHVLLTTDSPIPADFLHTLARMASNSCFSPTDRMVGFTGLIQSRFPLEREQGTQQAPIKC